MSLVEILALAILAIVPWGEGGATPAALAVAHTLVFLAAGAALVASRRRGGVDARLPWPLLAYLPFLVLGAISTLGAEYLFGAFETYWDQIVPFLLALALAISPGSRRGGLFAGAVVAGCGVVQAAPAIVTRIAAGVAVSPSFLNPNHLAAYLNVAALVALTRSGAGRSGQAGAAEEIAGAKPARARWVWIVAAAICASGTLATGSRGALLALVVTLTIAAARAGGWLTLRRSLPVIGVLSLLALLSVTARFSSTFDPYRYDRPRIWSSAAASWAEAPVLGLGPGMYAHRSSRHNFPQEKATFRYSKEPHSTHSQPLQVLAEEGVAGLAALLLFAVVSLAALSGESRGAGERGVAARSALLSVVVVLLQSLVETPFGPPAIPLTLLILAWSALAPAAASEAAASFFLRWPGGSGGRRERLDRAAVTTSVVVIGVVVWSVAVAAPFLSDAAARWAGGPGRAPARVDAGMRLAEDLNPWQPFLGYERARSAMARAERLSPSLLANAFDSLQKTQSLEPGDPSAFALMGRLYARALLDYPGAGPGAADAADRRYTEALERAPFDARLFVERGGFRLARGNGPAALSDSREAIRLEPRALAARQLEVEALLSCGRSSEASGALRRLDEEIVRLRGYEPLNGYESFLMRLDPRDLEKARGMVSSLLLLVVPDGGALGGGHRHEGGRRLLREDLIEEGLLRLALPGRLAVAVGVPVHAGLADDGVDGVVGQRLHGVIQDELAARAVVIHHVAEAQRPLDHRLTSEGLPL